MDFKNLVLIISAAFVIGFILAVIPYLYYEPREEVCEIENCHGLDIVCGSDPPEFCTEEYQVGDFCRKYAKCEIISGACTFVETNTFRECSDCISNCNKMSSEEIFVCEDICRDLFE